MSRKITTSGIQIFLTLGCIFSFSLLFSQTQIKGIIYDEDTNNAIPFANILNLQNGSGVNSDEKGEFKISVNELPATFQISYVGYKTDTVVINSSAKQVVFLKQDLQNLPTVEVNANQKLKTVNSSGFLPKTFVLWKGYIFLLSKNGTFGHYQIETFDNQGNFIKKHEIDIGRIHDLKVNCLNQLYVSNKKYSIRLDYAEQQLTPIEKIPTYEFDALFENCLCSNKNAFFYEIKLNNGLRKRYIKANKNAESSSLLKEIFYKERSEKYTADLKLISEGNTATNMGDIGVCENEKIRNLQEDSYFLETVFHRNPLENYLFSIDETIVFFNNDQQQIEFFDTEGVPVDSVQMQFSIAKNSNLSSIILDQETGIFYALTNESGNKFLSQIDLEKGILATKHSIEVQSFEKIKMVGNKLFVLGIPKKATGLKRKELMVKNIF